MRNARIGGFRKMVWPSAGNKRVGWKFLPVKGVRLLPYKSAVNIFGWIKDQGQPQPKDNEGKCYECSDQQATLYNSHGWAPRTLASRKDRVRNAGSLIRPTGACL